MRIKFVRQKIKDWGFVWAKHIKVAYVGLGWIGLQLSFGKDPFDAVGYQKFLENQFTKNCLVCGRGLRVKNIGQEIKYHKECRKFRKHPERYNGNKR